MSETFRPGRPQEIPAISRLVMHSFPGLASTPEWWEERFRTNPHGGTEALWVGEENGRLIAACQLHSFEQWIGGVRIPVMGLGTVAIAPTHRRRGLAGRMLAAGLRHARERGDLVSALYPFRISFYERYGYGLAGVAHQYIVPTELFPDAPERSRVRLVESDSDGASLFGVYDFWIQTQTGQMQRTPVGWRDLLDVPDSAAFLVMGEGGEAEGYVLVRYRADLPPAERFLEVEERAWLGPAARRAIYAWFGSLGDQWQRIAYRAHPDESFDEIIREPRLPRGSAPRWRLWFPSATLLRGPMFRLLDVPAAWRARPVTEDVALTIGVELRDEQIPENDGPWRLRFEGGRVEIERSAQRADGILRLPLSVFSRLFIADLAPSAAVAVGVATLDRPELLPLLDAALRLPRPWTFDRF